MNCPNCGNPNPDGAMFCDNCGTSMAGGAQPSGAPPTAPAVGVPPAPVVPPPAAAGGGTCPQCQTAVMPGQAFCENCGFALGSAPPPTPPPSVAPPPVQPVASTPPPVQPVTPAPPPAPVQPPVQQYGAMPPARLVMADGTQIQLTGEAEYLLGREDAVSGSFPEVDLDPYGAQSSGVSRQHAKIVAQGGYFLVDQNSVNGTWLNKQKVTPNQQMPLNNGDEIRLGKLVMNFYTG